MTLADIVERVKGLFKKDETPEEPRRELRDKHLESLEREWQYYENQKKKELLTKRLRQLKLQQVRERTFGITKHQKERTILDAKLKDSGLDLMHPKMNLMKAKRLFRH